MTTDLWAQERALWLEGVGEMRRAMDPGCIMAFPPTGLMQGEAILARLQDAPRWQDVMLSGQHATQSDDCAVLGYVATARRPGKTDYRALCTSVWRRQGRDWRLIQHQQSPF